MHKVWTSAKKASQKKMQNAAIAQNELNFKLFLKKCIPSIVFFSACYIGFVIFFSFEPMSDWVHIFDGFIVSVQVFFSNSRSLSLFPFIFLSFSQYFYWRVSCYWFFFVFISHFICLWHIELAYKNDDKNVI